VKKTLAELLTNSPTAILPAAIVQRASRAARVWCVVRSLDHPDNGGTGCGLVRITLEKLGEYLKRSPRSVWRYVREAKAKGFFRRCDFAAGEFEIEYTGLKPLAKLLGLPGLGAIGEFPLQEICHAKAYAAEIQAEDLQRQSFYLMKKEWGKYSRKAKLACELLAQEELSARMPGDAFIARGKRLLYLGPHWRPFGASQAGIAKKLGVSVRTVQYRFCAAWREERNLPLLNKAQAAHQIKQEYPVEYLRLFYKFAEKPDEKHVFYGNRLFEVGTNLYHSTVALRSQKMRKADYVTEGFTLIRTRHEDPNGGDKITVYSPKRTTNTAVFSVAPGRNTRGLQSSLAEKEMPDK
jgi:hypothetical protein